MRNLHGILGWCAIGLLSLLIASPALADDVFTGGWQVKCTPNSATVALGGDAFDDGMLFENGQFSAQAYAGLGFTPASYSIDATGKFTATLTSSDRGTVIWKGRVGTGTIHGVILWTKPDNTLYKYYYTGTAAVADASAGD